MGDRIILYAIPGFVALLFIEIWLSLRTAKGQASHGYEPRDTFASLAMGIGSLIAKASVAAAVFACNSYLYEHRLIDLPKAWWVWALAILGDDFCYYWFHRFHHQIRFLWAGHISHHSSQHYNLSTALRQPWTTVITGPIFWAPLPIIGIAPKTVLVAQAISLIYQYWIHTELIGSMGPFGWIFNTPAHHRVHHGRNSIYLDRNHGGILILWDRLFGTFEPESVAVDYGLTTNISTYNPLRIAFHEYLAIAKDLRSNRGLRNRLAYIFAAPGWSHDKSRETSRFGKR